MLSREDVRSLHLPGLHAGGLQPVDKGMGVLADLPDAIRARQGRRVQDDACTERVQVGAMIITNSSCRSLALEAGAG